MSDEFIDPNNYLQIYAEKKPGKTTVTIEGDGWRGSEAVALIEIAKAAIIQKTLKRRRFKWTGETQ